MSDLHSSDALYERVYSVFARLASTHDWNGERYRRAVKEGFIIDCAHHDHDDDALRLSEADAIQQQQDDELCHDKENQPCISVNSSPLYSNKGGLNAICSTPLQSVQVVKPASTPQPLLQSPVCASPFSPFSPSSLPTPPPRVMITGRSTRRKQRFDPLPDEEDQSQPQHFVDLTIPACTNSPHQKPMMMMSSLTHNNISEEQEHEVEVDMSMNVNEVADDSTKSIVVEPTYISHNIASQLSNTSMRGTRLSFSEAVSRSARNSSTPIVQELNHIQHVSDDVEQSADEQSDELPPIADEMKEEHYAIEQASVELKVNAPENIEADGSEEEEDDERLIRSKKARKKRIIEESDEDDEENFEASIPSIDSEQHGHESNQEEDEKEDEHEDDDSPPVPLPHPMPSPNHKVDADQAIVAEIQLVDDEIMQALPEEPHFEEIDESQHQDESIEHSFEPGQQEEEEAVQAEVVMEEEQQVEEEDDEDEDDEFIRPKRNKHRKARIIDDEEDENDEDYEEPAYMNDDEAEEVDEDEVKCEEEAADQLEDEDEDDVSESCESSSESSCDSSSSSEEDEWQPSSNDDDNDADEGIPSQHNKRSISALTPTTRTNPPCSAVKSHHPSSHSTKSKSNTMDQKVDASSNKKKANKNKISVIDSDEEEEYNSEDRDFIASEDDEQQAQLVDDDDEDEYQDDDDDDDEEDETNDDSDDDDDDDFDGWSNSDDDLPRSKAKSKQPKPSASSSKVPKAAAAAEMSQASFSRKRVLLFEESYAEFNERIFSNRLPLKPALIWSKTLRKTAGICVHRGCELVRIELSEKVCDTYMKMRETLAHEMCHAAVATIDRIVKAPSHGKLFQKWGALVTRTMPALGKITTCHNYEIFYKFRYQCSNGWCKKSFGRHSDSVDVEKHVCSRCGGKIVKLGRFNPDGTPAKERTASGFALYVKQQYSNAKTMNPNTRHKDLMKVIAAQYQSNKTQLAAASSASSSSSSCLSISEEQAELERQMIAFNELQL